MISVGGAIKFGNIIKLIFSHRWMFKIPHYCAIFFTLPDFYKAVSLIIVDDKMSLDSDLDRSSDRIE